MSLASFDVPGADAETASTFRGLFTQRCFLLACWLARSTDPVSATYGNCLSGFFPTPDEATDVWRHWLGPLLFPHRFEASDRFTVLPWGLRARRWMTTMVETDGALWIPQTWPRFSLSLCDQMDVPGLASALSEVCDLADATPVDATFLQQLVALTAPLADFHEKTSATKVRKQDGRFFTGAQVVSELCRYALDTFVADAVPTACSPDGPCSFFDRYLAHPERPSHEDRPAFQYPDHLGELRICDPAAGGGAFLLGMWVEWMWYAMGRRAQPRSRVVAVAAKGFSVLYGLDINPLAVATCRTRFRLLAWLLSRDEAPVSIGDVRRRIVHGDATIPRWYEAEAPNAWPGRGGFDMVVGNPPYVDSERMVNQGAGETRRRLSRDFQLTRGNWDLYIAFFELGFRLLQQDGVLVYVTPDKWLAKPFGEALRRFARPSLALLCDAGRRLFQDARVDAVFAAFRGRGSDDVAVAAWGLDGLQVQAKIAKKTLVAPYRLDYLLSSDLTFLQQTFSLPHRLGEWVAVENACTTADAYALAPFIEEAGSRRSASRTLRVLNTGTLSKYHNRWGLRPLTYLKTKTQKPVVNRESFARALPSRYLKRALRPKLIVKGLTLLDASVDFEGAYLPAKSTLLVFAESEEELAFWAMVVNSRFAARYLCERFRGSSYNGGVNFTCDMLRELPLPFRPTRQWCRAARFLVGCILATPPDHDVSVGLRRFADRLVDAYYQEGSAGILWREWCVFAAQKQAGGGGRRRLARNVLQWAEGRLKSGLTMDHDPNV